MDALAKEQRDLGLSLWETIGSVVKEKRLNPRVTAALDVFRQIITGLGERVTAGGSLETVVKAATLETGYARWLEEEKTDEAEARLANIQELVTAAAEAEEEGETLRDFIDHAALVSDTDQYKADARVTLMTTHAAKGLEFAVVFIVGMEEGLFPHLRSAASEDDLEEERRLCYVAITRAQHQLYITQAMRRRTWGEERAASPSRFLKEIPLELMEDLSLGPSWLGFSESEDAQHNRHAASALRGETPRPVKKPSNFAGKTYNSVDSVNDFFKRRMSQSSSDEPRQESRELNSSSSDYRTGTRVRHARYGAGVVVRVEGAGEDAKLTVNFPGYGQKKFIAKFAALEKK
jgi:DNA helicase-2/ATP-dependent DNA helicase PcrA